jgi:hypothetical protein
VVQFDFGVSQTLFDCWIYPALKAAIESNRPEGCSLFAAKIRTRKSVLVNAHPTVRIEAFPDNVVDLMPVCFDKYSPHFLCHLADAGRYGSNLRHLDIEIHEIDVIEFRQ